MNQPALKGSFDRLTRQEITTLIRARRYRARHRTNRRRFDHHLRQSLQCHARVQNLAAKIIRGTLR